MTSPTAMNDYVDNDNDVNNNDYNNLPIRLRVLLLLSTVDRKLKFRVTLLVLLVKATVTPDTFITCVTPPGAGDMTDMSGGAVDTMNGTLATVERPAALMT